MLYISYSYQLKDKKHLYLINKKVNNKILILKTYLHYINYKLHL